MIAVDTLVYHTGYDAAAGVGLCEVCTGMYLVDAGGGEGLAHMGYERARELESLHAVEQRHGLDLVGGYGTDSDAAFQHGHACTHSLYVGCGCPRGQLYQGGAYRWPGGWRFADLAAQRRGRLKRRTHQLDAVGGAQARAGSACAIRC